MTITTYNQVSVDIHSLSTEELIQVLGHFAQVNQELLQDKEHLEETNTVLNEQVQTISTLIQESLLPKIKALKDEQEKNDKAYKENTEICNQTISSLTNENNQLKNRISQLESQNAAEKTIHEQAMQAKNVLITTLNGAIDALNNTIAALNERIQQIGNRIHAHIQHDRVSYSPGPDNPHVAAYYKQIEDNIFLGTPIVFTPKPGCIIS